MPPDMAEWLPEGHLARFVIETVDELDLSAIYGYYRADGHGRPAHDPAMMVALVLYSYAVGVTSSRAIERRCVEDVAFRVITVNRQPDHATIARFLIRHQDALQGLFFEVLALCQRAGMVTVGRVAVDSTKLAANASPAQNRTLEALRDEAERIIEEAIETDRREDELYEDKRGDELPQELADPRTRKARIRELLEQARREAEAIEAEHAEIVARHQEHLATTGRRLRGRPPGSRPGHKRRVKLARKVNLTDPDSALVHHRGMRMQGYAIQTAVNDHQIILATHAHGGNDQGQLTPTIQKAEHTLQQLGIDDPIKEVVADGGYWSIADVSALLQRTRVLIPPPHNAKDPGNEHPITQQMRQTLNTDAAQASYRQRQAIVEPVYAYWKFGRGITRLFRRGKAKVQADADLIATTHNLLKLHNRLQTG